MGEHEIRPIRICYVSPLRQLKMCEQGLELCETDDHKIIMRMSVDVWLRECLQLSEDMMRLCYDTEIGII